MHALTPTLVGVTSELISDQHRDDLAQRAASGDEAALDELLLLIRPAVARRCSRVLSHPQDAEDATQDALLAVARGIRTFEGRSRFTTWLWTVVSNSAFATYRRMRQHADRTSHEMPDVADTQHVSVLAGARVDLTEAIETLRRERPEIAEAVVLCDIGGLEYAEIATALGLPLGTVKSRIAGGRSALKAMLTR